MEEWIQALKVSSKQPPAGSQKERLSGAHSWYVCSHARPTFCNVCREALNGVTSHGLSCEICKYKIHKRCASKADRNCKWTTLASIGASELIEDEDRNIHMPHQWLEGNLPVNAKCSYCEKACGSVLRMQDFRCLWCKAYVHNHCKENFFKRCSFGVCRVSILMPTHVKTVASDGYIRASKAQNSSPLVVFVNSKSGDNQGVKFLRKFKQLLNPYQVFDLIEDGPLVGLRLFQNFECFRVIVCGGDGSVGWVLKEIDNLDLHKQCQIGVLPLGTGNDLARVLGWGAALDDDNQLAKLLESFERATTKMLDRWSMMTYNVSNNSGISETLAQTNTDKLITGDALKKLSYVDHPNSQNVFDFKVASTQRVSNIPIGISHFSINQALEQEPQLLNKQQKSPTENLSQLEDSIWYHLSNMLQNENINNIIESSQILQTKVTEALIRVNDMYNSTSASQITPAITNTFIKNTTPVDKEEESRIMNAMAAVVTDQCISLKHKLNEFFSLLKSELKTSEEGHNSESASVSDSGDSRQPDKFESISSKSSFASINYPLPSIENLSGVSKDADNYLNVNRSNSNEQNVKNGCALSCQNLTNLNNNYMANQIVCQSSINLNFGSKNEVSLTPLGSCSSSINRRKMLNSISKLFHHRRKIMTHANSLKKSIKQILQLADKNTTLNSMINQTINSQPNSNGDSVRTSINSQSLDISFTDSETKKFLVQKLENMDDLPSSNPSRHLIYDDIDDDNFDFDKLGINHIQAFDNIPEHDTHLLLKISDKKNKCKNRSRSELNSSSHLSLNGLFEESTQLIKRIEKRPIPASNSFTSGKVSEFQEGGLMGKSVSGSSGSTQCASCKLEHHGNDQCPLASEEQSCISTPTQNGMTKSCLSIEDSFSNRNCETWKLENNFTSISLSDNGQQSFNPFTSTTDSTFLSAINPIRQQFTRPTNLSLISSTSENLSPKLPQIDHAPKINITITDTCGPTNLQLDYDSDRARFENSRSPSFLGYLTSQSSLAPTPTDQPSRDSPSLKIVHNKRTKLTPAPLFLLPPSASSSALKSNSHQNLNLNSSSSSNNLSARLNEFNFLRLPPSPSGYSSSGSCYSKNSIQPSPRISKKYSQNVHQKTGSTYHLKLPAFSSKFRQRSLSKSSDKSSSPTSPSSPKLLFKYNPITSPYGFVSQALLFNTDTLCAPISAAVNNNPEPILELFNERAVMNNYFGIGLDAKLSLEFHMTREEHPEKCKSRMRNHMLYGILGSKELIQRTYKNLEQKVLLECDGTKIPLKNVQGIVVLNIPSYTGGVNFWGHNSKTEHTFTVPSFDDKILEVVAVSGCIQMALSRVVSIKSNRIAQCRSVKIQILGTEGVPVQVDGEAWIQPPGFIYLVHKNRAQMLTRNKVFEQTLKTWSEKQSKNDFLSVSGVSGGNTVISNALGLNKDELSVLQNILDASITLIKRIKTASLKNVYIEQDLYGYATQASSNLDEICINGRIIEKSLRQQVTDFLNSIRTLHVETSLFINEKVSKLGIDPEITEKIQTGLNGLKVAMKKLNDCQGLFHLPLDTDDASDDLDFKKKSRFNLVQRYKKSKLKHKDDKELLKTLHGISIEEWSNHEVSLWLESIHMTEYKAAFLRHDIRGTEVRNLERRDLRELGIVKVGHIKRILNASKEIPKRVTREKQSV